MGTTRKADRPNAQEQVEAMMAAGERRYRRERRIGIIGLLWSTLMLTCLIGVPANSSVPTWAKAVFFLAGLVAVPMWLPLLTHIRFALELKLRPFSYLAVYLLLIVGINIAVQIPSPVWTNLYLAIIGLLAVAESLLLLWRHGTLTPAFEPELTSRSYILKALKELPNDPMMNEEPWSIFSFPDQDAESMNGGLNEASKTNTQEDESDAEQKPADGPLRGH